MKFVCIEMKRCIFVIENLEPTNNKKIEFFSNLSKNKKDKEIQEPKHFGENCFSVSKKK